MARAAASPHQGKGNGQRSRRRAATLIAYFDTSAFIKLLIDEQDSTDVRRLWETSAGPVSSRLLYPEARAALAAAARAGRVAPEEHVQARDMLEELWGASDRIAVRPAVAHRAGDLAEEHALRGYDAVHLASFETIASDDTVLVTFDGGLRRAARAMGFAVSPPSR